MNNTIRQSNGLANIIIYLIFVSVTFGSRFLSFSFGSYQMTLFRLMTIILVIVVIVTNSRKLVISFKNKALETYFVPLLLFYSIITFIWCKDMSNWVQAEFFIFIAFVLYWSLSKFLDNIDYIYRCLIAFEISILIQAFIGTYEYFTGNYLFLHDASRLFSYTRYGINYPVAMQHNINNFGVLMVFGVCIEYTLLKKTNVKIIKLIHLCLMFLCSWLTYESTSRGALLALGVVYVCILLFFTKGIAKKLLVVSAAVVAIVFLFNYVRSILVFGAIEEDIRTKLAINGLHFTVDSFFCGIGSGQSTWWFQNRSIVNCGNITIFHNTWIELMATYGVLVFILYVLVYFKMFISFFKVGRKEESPIGYLAQGFFLFLASFVIGCVTASSMFILEWFWLALAMMLIFSVTFCHQKG